MIHYEKLANLLKSRTEAKKVHRVLRFNQSRWLKQYVEFNTQKNRSQVKMVKEAEKYCRSQ